MQCLVVIPAYNEAKNIISVLDGISSLVQDVDILVINDCSKDDTENVVRSKGYNVISLCCNLGYSGAILTGLKYASEKNYDYVIQFDGDGQHDPNDIKKLINEIEKEKCDIIIGSRFLEKNTYNHGLFRKIGTSTFKLLIKTITGTQITDPTSGLQIINKKAFEYYVRSGNYPDYPDANLIILMLKLGYKIIEIPATMHERLSGVGMHDSPYKNVKYMISMFYSLIIFALKGSGKKERSKYGL